MQVTPCRSEIARPVLHRANISQQDQAVLLQVGGEFGGIEAKGPGLADLPLAALRQAGAVSDRPQQRRRERALWKGG